MQNKGMTLSGFKRKTISQSTGTLYTHVNDVLAEHIILSISIIRSKLMLMLILMLILMLVSRLSSLAHIKASYACVASEDRPLYSPPKYGANLALFSTEFSFYHSAVARSNMTCHPEMTTPGQMRGRYFISIHN